MNTFDTPILFLIFNRPDTTRRVFEAIRMAKPKQLFVAADGPRDDKFGEKEICEKVREIATQIDWHCELKTLFRDTNLGCGRGPGEAITWFFENVEMGIILEDDCLPHPSFFYYCQELLQRYFFHTNVMNISGNNQVDVLIKNYSYYFSKYNHTWGWATWRRAWKNYDYEIFTEEPLTIQQWMKRSGLSKEEQIYWSNISTELNGNHESIWDYQWLFTVWKFQGVSITPKLNLVSNIGFSPAATHTKDTANPFSMNPTFASDLPLKHPPSISVDRKLDIKFAKNYGIIPLRKTGLFKRIYKKIRSIERNRFPQKVSDAFPRLLGIPKSEIRRLKRSQESTGDSVIFNTPLKISDSFWHLHSLNEIFLEEVYKFHADTSEPFIIDCGANIGLSILYFKKLYRFAKVTAFEPDKGIYDMLLQNLESFNLTDVEIWNKAVWIKQTELRFLANGSVSGKIYENLQGQPSDVPIQTVESVRLKDLLTCTVDFLKIDIEGAEYDVINDCKDVLHHVRNLFVEYHSNPTQPQLLSELLSILRDSGFRVYIKEAWNNLPYPFLFKQHTPYYDLQLNTFAYHYPVYEQLFVHAGSRGQHLGLHDRKP